MSNPPRVPRNRIELAGFIELSVLSLAATSEDIRKACDEARKLSFFAVVVTPCRTKETKDLLLNSDVKTISVVAFPFGYVKPESKILETELAIKDGATEIDMVANVGELRSGNFKLVENEISAVLNVTLKESIPLKVIIETSALTQGEIEKASKMVSDSGAQFVKTNTGFGSRGVTIEDVELIRESVGPRFGIKAAGGISNAQKALDLIKAGATRIGTSHGRAILDSFIDVGAI